MISVVQLALGGLAPPLLAIHLAFAGMAPVEDVQQTTQQGGGGVAQQAKRKPIFVQGRQLERDAAVIEAPREVAPEQNAAPGRVVGVQTEAERFDASVAMAIKQAQRINAQGEQNLTFQIAQAAQFYTSASAERAAIEALRKENDNRAAILLALLIANS